MVGGTIAVLLEPNFITNTAILFTGWIIVAIVIIVSIIAARKLSNNITLPMSQLAQGATEIARGNFSHLIQIDSKSEIGRVAKLFNYMTTELRRLNDMNLYKIIVEKTKTATIIRNIADGVIVTDQKNNILVLNSVAELWFGVKEKKAINKSIDESIKNKKLLKLIKNVAENVQSYSKLLLLILF